MPETVTVDLDREQAEELIHILANYIDHYTDGDHYNGDPEVPALMSALVNAVYLEVDYSADDFYAGGAE